jgi:hypothetical protein
LSCLDHFMFLLFLSFSLLTTTSSNAMSNQISNMEEQIKSLIMNAEEGDTQSIERAYELALTDKNISKLNSLDEENMNPISILLENQVEIYPNQEQNGVKKVERREFKINDYSAIAWILHKIYQEPNTLYIYALAKRMLNWYMTAAIMARVDASRCEDKTAPQGIMIIESEFIDIKKTLQNKEVYDRAIRFGLAQEETFKNRLPPKWICNHGMESFTGKEKYKDEKTWDSERNRIRENIESKITK